MFSPCVRGCSYSCEVFEEAGKVFPVRAGVFLLTPSIEFQRCCFPRACGGVPGLWQLFKPVLEFSPHARAELAKVWHPVFPACAGVIPSFWPMIRILKSFPRVCGGDPQCAALRLRRWFSPCVRG